VRAKNKIRAARIPYRVPRDADLPDRLPGVLAVVYLVFTEGHATATREDLAAESIRLARLLAALMPDEPEVLGLLGLLLLTEARRPARTSADGTRVLLADQDRSRWDRREIDEGLRILRRAEGLRRPGPYQLQATIAAGHAEGASPAAIAAVYDALVELDPSPVVRLNRAVAVALAGDVEAALELVDELEELGGYGYLHAARADLLRRLGRADEAAESYVNALSLTDNVPERRFLERRLRELARPDVRGA